MMSIADGTVELLGLANIYIGQLYIFYILLHDVCK